MAGRRLLKNGAPRLLDNHAGREGRDYYRAYTALEQMFGPFLNEFIRNEAGRCALAWVQLQRASRELVAMQRKRRTGRGRKPNERQIERMARRQGLSDGSYQSAVRRWEELVARQPRSSSNDVLAELMRR